MERISVIVLTRNSEKYLRQCLDSIFMQTYPNHEVIIIDSHSTDDTHKILSMYIKENQYKIYHVTTNPRHLLIIGNNIKILFFEKDISVGLARKIGCEQATGEILAYIDADVELPYPEWLENMHKPFIEYPDIAGVQTLAKCRPTDPESLKKIHARFEYKHRVIGINNYQSIGTSHLLIKKHVLEHVGGFQDVFSGEDIPVMKKIMEEGYNFIYLKEEKCYHHHPSSFFEHYKRLLRSYKNVIKTKLLR